jgi:hypothetical protein
MYKCGVWTDRKKLNVRRMQIQVPVDIMTASIPKRAKASGDGQHAETG